MRVGAHACKIASGFRRALFLWFHAYNTCVKSSVLIIALTCVALAIGLACRLYVLLYFPVWRDELYALEYSNHSYAELLTGALDLSRPPLYHILLKVLANISTHYLWLRSISLFCFLINFFLLVKTGNRTAGSRFGYMLGSLYALSGYFLLFDWTIRPYALLTTTILLAMHYVFSKREYSLVLVGILTAGLYIDYAFVYAVVTLFLYALYRFIFNGEREYSRLLAVICLSVLLFLPYVPIQISAMVKLTHALSWNWQYINLPFVLPYVSGSFWMPQEYYFRLMLWVLGAIALVRQPSKNHLGMVLTLGVFISFWIGYIVVILGLPIIHVRHYQFVALGILYGSAYAFHRLRDWAPGLLLFACFVLYSVVALVIEVTRIFTVPSGFLLTFN
jgi:hypothetical protein